MNTTPTRTEICGIKKTTDHKGVFSLFGYRPNMVRPGLVPVLGLYASILLVGCGGDQSREPDRNDYYTDQSSSVFSPEPINDRPPLDDDQPIWEQGDATTTTSGGESSSLIGGWSIVLTKIESGDMARAQQLLRVIQEETRLREAFIDERSDGLVIAYGNFLGREAAEKELVRVRGTDMLGTKPFESAIVRPPSGEALMGSNPAFDLRTVKKRYGKQAVYTLQIGVYGRNDYQTPSPEELSAYRQAAEKAVRDLRSQGDTAFYYHSPSRSMVTVGVFGEKDFDSTVYPAYQSPRLKATREKFPNNLLNGQGIKETRRTESGIDKRMQSSQLVAIPEK